MWILFLVKFNREEDELKTLVLMNAYTGHRFATVPEYIKGIEEGKLELVSCQEVLNTGSQKMVNMLISHECMEKMPALVGIYDRQQRYGGPEEGGWYYYTTSFVSCKNVELPYVCEEDTDIYGEGCQEEFEPVPGFHQNLRKQHYC